MRRATLSDADVLNVIANHPDVLPWITEDGLPVDFTGAIEKNVILMTDLGAFVFELVKDGVYRAHMMFLPEGRGRHALSGAKWAADYMFGVLGAKSLETLSPDDGMWAGPPRSFGFKRKNRIENYIRGHGAWRWVLSREDWS